ncbi:mycofactocin biosynthesis chaperone MftB [Nocardiopsis sediminis]|uniref:Mycofactocin biosynthesis chaperone MftB n=1 Tax=Nocardiopsis sediminis TaxID=1778267 RepID=A0ABV8FZA7_9ACTN
MPPDDSPATAAPPALDLDAPWDLHPQVAVRPEPFGALLYHFGTRRLSFLKDPVLLAVVRALPGHATARGACDHAGVGAAQLHRYARALATLAATGMVIRRTPRAAQPPDDATR